MTTAIPETRDTVNSLIEICNDGQHGFESAAHAISAEEPLLRSELMQYSRQRQEFAAELEAEMQRMGEEPITHGTLSGALHRGWMKLKEAIAMNNRLEILAECERAEDAALDSYRHATNESLPGAVGDLVMTQYQAVNRVRDRMRALHEAAKHK